MLDRKIREYIHDLAGSISSLDSSLRKLQRSQRSASDQPQESVDAIEKMQQIIKDAAQKIRSLRESLVAAKSSRVHSGVQALQGEHNGVVKVLILDDSRSASLKLAYDLTRWGYECHSIHRVEETLPLLMREYFDCVLIDYEMPHQSGPEVCAEIKGHESLRSMPLIILTAKESDDAIVKSIDAGADDYVNKSSDVRILESKIKAALRTRHFQRLEVEVKQLEAVKALMVTYHHRINNKLASALSCVHRLDRQQVEVEDLCLQQLRQSLDEIALLLKNLERQDQLNVEDYTDEVKMLKVD